MDEMRQCRIFNCDRRHGNICCADCNLRIEGRCKDYCRNKPTLCGLVKQKTSGRGISKPHIDPRSKAVLQYSLDGKLIARHPSIIDAAHATGLSASGVSSAIQRGGRSRKYIFKFEEDDH